MMDDYPLITEFPEDVWNVSEWIPQLLVDRRLRKLVKEGKQLPSNAVVESVVNELICMVKANNGLSYKVPLDYEPVLKGLEKE